VKTASQGENRFADATRYAAYLDTPEGRLRSDLTIANLREFLPAQSSLHAIDVGGGTGITSIALARLGFEVALLDSSSATVEIAARRAMEAEVSEKITLKQGDASDLATLFQQELFDVVVCHNLLEYVNDPEAVLRDAVRLMRDSSGVLSVLVRNQAGEVLKASLNGGDLAAAERNLSAEWGHESLYGGAVRLFSQDSLEAMLTKSGLKIIGRRGVRVLSDYLPKKISRSDNYDRIFVFERKLATRHEFVGIARYLHYFATLDAGRSHERR
jgi:S-adenosylmethionine-dependent methyltransferase